MQTYIEVTTIDQRLAVDSSYSPRAIEDRTGVRLRIEFVMSWHSRQPLPIQARVTIGDICRLATLGRPHFYFGPRLNVCRRGA